MDEEQQDLFQSLECDHLPVQQRIVKDGYLVCLKCGKRLRPINLRKQI